MPEHDLEADLIYSAEPGDIYTGMSNVALLCPYETGHVIHLPRAAVPLLGLCQSGRSLDEHADRAQRNGMFRDRTATIGMLRNLAARGALRLRPNHVAAPHPAESEGIGVLAITTADRPKLLERAVASYWRALRSANDSRRLLVVDGSSDAGNLKANRDVVHAFQSLGCPIEHSGDLDRSGLESEIRSAGVPGSIVRWMLPGEDRRYAPGATRNLLTLLTAGRRVLCVDDDTIGNLHVHRSCRPGLALVGHTDPRETRWWDRRSEACAAEPVCLTSPVLAHEPYLGQVLSRLVRLAPSIDTESACSHLNAGALGIRRRRVRLTWVGVLGDAAVYCPHTALFMTGPTRDAMASAERRFDAAFRTREVSRLVPQVTVTDEPWFMAYCSGIDNASLVPPFSPTGTNEDGFFAALLRLCDSEAVVVQLPYAIEHDSARDSHYGDGVIQSARRVRQNDLLLCLLRAWPPSCLAEDPGERLKRLAEVFQDMGRLSSVAFEAVARKTAIDLKWMTLARSEELEASGYPYPPFWKRAFDRYRSVLLDSLRQDDFFVPLEFEGMSKADAMSRFQGHCSMLGEALFHWPDVWSLANKHQVHCAGRLRGAQRP